MMGQSLTFRKDDINMELWQRGRIVHLSTEKKVFDYGLLIQYAVTL